MLMVVFICNINEALTTVDACKVMYGSTTCKCVQLSFDASLGAINIENMLDLLDVDSIIEILLLIQGRLQLVHSICCCSSS